MATVLIEANVALTNQQIIEKIKADYPDIINPRIVQEDEKGKVVKFQVNEGATEYQLLQWAKNLPKKSAQQPKPEQPKTGTTIGQDLEDFWEKMQADVLGKVEVLLKDKEPDTVKKSVQATAEMLRSYDEKFSGIIEEFNKAAAENNQVLENNTIEVKRHTQDLAEKGEQLTQRQELLTRHQTELQKEQENLSRKFVEVDNLITEMKQEHQAFSEKVGKVFGSWRD